MRRRLVGRHTGGVFEMKQVEPKPKRQHGVLVGAVLLTLLLGGGCASLTKGWRHPDEDPRYWATIYNANRIVHPFTEMTSDCCSAGEHIFMMPLNILDLPFSLFFDTLAFPFEQYDIEKDRRQKALEESKMAEWIVAVENGTFDKVDVAKTLAPFAMDRLNCLLDQQPQDNIPVELLEVLYDVASKSEAYGLIGKISEQKISQNRCCFAFAKTG